MVSLGTAAPFICHPTLTKSAVNMIEWVLPSAPYCVDAMVVAGRVAMPWRWHGVVPGIPATFAVEAGWVSSITIVPSHISTRGGRAQATVSEPQTTGIVRVWARVDQTTAQTHLTVQTYQRKSAD